jgi:regulator of protease activity HflC (stomatin/prohibitin superfamily)
MFDWIKDLLKQLWEELIPFVVVNHYDRGVRLRFGKRIGTVIEPGLCWKFPFSDKILTVMVKPTTMDLSEQTITTANNVQVVIEAAIKYEIKDPVKLLLEVNSAVDALADMSKGIIRTVLVAEEWPACNGNKVSQTITKLVNEEAKKWGCAVSVVTISTMAPMRSIRLLQSYAYKSNENKG